MSAFRISEVADALGLSVDTLRYYERIGLLPNVPRTESGIRRYDDNHLATLRFIKRAQLMNFCLSEIGLLLKFRKSPARSRKNVRDLASVKLGEIDARLESLKDLRNELGKLVEACPNHADGCAIISGIERLESGNLTGDKRAKSAR